MNQLTPAQLHALALVAKGASKVRDKLVAQDYPVDFGVQISGVVTVSGDQTVTLSTKPSAVDVIASLLSEWGPKKRIEIASAVSAEKLAAVTPEQRLLATEIFDRLAIQAPTTRRGSVAGKLDVAVID